MKTKISTRFRVALGQVGLLISVLLLAMLLGLVPDRQTAIRHGRAVLAESIVVKTSNLITPNDIQGLDTILNMFVERNDDLLSAAVRREDRSTFVVVGDHLDKWQAMPGEFSSNTQVRVPIYSGNQRWGQLELRFVSANMFYGFDFAQSQIIPLVLFIALVSFVMFYAYLGKMLKHLDPTKAIPPRVRAALDTLAEGLLVVDLRGQIVLANRAYAAIVNETFDNLLGRHAQDFDWLTSDGLAMENADAPWTCCLQTGIEIRNVEVKLIDHQGVLRTFHVNCTPVMSSGAKHGGVLIGLDDVTKLEQQKKVIAEAKDAAVSANQAKSQFLANMSHEIRTPMNAILGFTEVLRRGYGSPQDVKSHLNTIHSSGKHLLELINDILDLSKVESGRLEVERIPCSPLQVIRDVVKVLGVNANEQGIKLTFETDGFIPESISSDPSRIRQIVTNLIGNAIKFTKQGGVKIILRLIVDEIPKLQIDIVDSGIGMTQAQLERIFEPFAQADSSVTRQFGGTGLGLTISRQFANALGGSITVASEIGRGSVFSVLLDTGPLEGIGMVESDSSDALDGTEPEQRTNWQFNAQRVLVVDDGTENRELVRLVLQEANLSVVTAENGKLGSDLALAEPFDLILMDMQMPVMDGYAATRLLRERGVNIPIFALTAHAMEGFEKGCLDAGCSGFLTKPIEIDRMLATIGEVLIGETSVETIDPSTLPSPVVVGGAPLVSNLPLEIPEFVEIVIAFRVRLDDVLQEMRDALVAGNYRTLGELAHWLKGSGGTVGFLEFTDPAARLEEFAQQNRLEESATVLVEIAELAERIQVPNVCA